MAAPPERPLLRDLLAAREDRVVRLWWSALEDGDDRARRPDPSRLPTALSDAVAALANTDGGEVALDLSGAARPPGPDVLADGVRAALGDGVADGCRVEVADGHVVRVAVAPAAVPVLAAPRHHDGRRRLLVRVNGATRELTGDEAAEYRRQRWA